MVTQVGKALGSCLLRWPPPHVGTEDWAVRGQVLPRLMRPQPLVCTDDLPSRHCCSREHGQQLSSMQGSGAVWLGS